MIAESPLVLPESVYTSVSDQRRVFRLNFFFKEGSCHGIFYFLFGISALDLFYLSALLGCCLSVLVESGGCRIILLLLYLIFISKNPKIFAYHHALHLEFCVVLALDLLWSISQDFI